MGRGERSREESGTAAPAGLTASTHKQQTEETDKQAAEQEAADAIKRQLGMQHHWRQAACPLLEKCTFIFFSTLSENWGLVSGGPQGGSQSCKTIRNP